MSPERLSEIDRELDAFGKSDEELRAVVERARAWAAVTDELDRELDALAEGADETAPRTEAVGELPRAPIESAGSEKRESDPAPGGRDIAGLSVDELFADAPSSAQSSSAEIAELFEEPNLLDGADHDAPLADLFDDASFAPTDGAESLELEGSPRAPDDLGSLEEVLEPQSEPPPSEAPDPELNPFGEEEDEITASFDVRDVERVEAEAAAISGRREPTGDLELLEESEPADPPTGLISRILGRK